ncbi:MAG: bifunctional 2-methylcitrate synthase/citrate synthase [Roseitalea sp.]|jgi:citrate synthase|nr:bifunctional 2-methylcitrate synthase/citrate synthase [Roseitalea sp.]MBO6723175.1 bifunctional 2-methylcitrate synthase/citrate synthase [Roseitalea sp.]MBO6745246.1 bifunctional 2-methylcitrate synthase/citrate synthase [Roseitalea sp.]
MTGSNTSPEIRFGLAGVIVDETAVSSVMAETNSLTYRGYPVQDLAARCSFEEVACLLLHGDLPGKADLAAFAEEERAQRALDDDHIRLIAAGPKQAHPMDTLRTVVSALGERDPDAGDDSPKALLRQSVRLLAKLPTIVAADQRIRRGHKPIPPDPGLPYTKNFFNMCFGAVPEPAVLRCFETSLVLYAEHSFNASTFAARVITSTLSDLCSAVVGAIGALKGPLHGGANEAVMHMMLEIGTPDRAEAFINRALDEKRKIMGFGHRVYKDGDSRVPTMTRAFRQMAQIKDGGQWVEMADIIEKTMSARTGIKPNLDFPTGPAYHLMGFDIPVFTPIFVMSRITGWCAHIIEQSDNNKLIRPLSAYIGPKQRPVAGHPERV